MTAPFTDVCALGLTEERLSAWRDGLLDPAELARIEAHVTTCQACQRRLDEFERLGWALRGQPSPDLRWRVWSGLQARMSETRRTSMTTRMRTLWASGAAIAAAVIVVALFAGLLAHRGGTTTPIGSGTPGTTATVVPSPSATVSATQPPAVAPSGWTVAQSIGTGYLPDIAFSASSPSTAYAYQAEQSGAIVVSVSQDGGATWRQLGTATTGQERCDPSVDPADARDVLLVCTPGSSSNFTILRSHDGGATWTKPRLTGIANCYGGSGWAGSTALLTFSFCEGMSSQTQIFASANEGPFTQKDINGKLSGHAVGLITLLGGNATAMYVQTGVMQFDQNGAQMNETTLRSADGGKTWSPVTFSQGGKRIHLLTMSPDGQTFVGVYDGAATQLALSTDGGQSWRKLPAGPAGVPSFNNLLVAPDGTIVATSSRLSLVDNPDPHLYMMRAGASAWTTPFDVPANAFPRALALDTSGHPTALWANYALDDRGSAWELIARTL